MSEHTVIPHEDYGFFGPDSVTWKVFSYPTSLTVGFQRTVVTEMYEPFLLASVQDTQAVMKRPALRYDRTMQYMSTIAFHDSRSVLKASDVLVKIHNRIVGTEPLSGLSYDANDPETQLWIHLTAWHSVLYTYEKFGPGKLTEAEETRYWQECARAAEFQTINLADVPRSRQEMRAYYARMRPKLAATEATQQHVEHLLDGAANLVPDSPWLWPVRKSLQLVFRKATIATLPRWMRKMAGVTQSRATDALITAMLRPAFALIARSPRVVRYLVRIMSPLTAPVVEPILCAVPPTNPVTWTSQQARERDGMTDPRELYATAKAARQAVTEHAPRDGQEPLLAFS
jgi:uncharacterized protein (DUF2236 family)